MPGIARIIRRFFCRTGVVCLWLTCAASGALAASEGVFPSYEAYQEAVKEAIFAEDYRGLVVQLGGEDEYSELELDQLQEQFKAALPRKLEQAELLKRVDTGGALRQELIAFWTGEQYLFFYAAVHLRENDLVVLHFLANTSVKSLLAQF